MLHKPGSKLMQNIAAYLVSMLMCLHCSSPAPGAHSYLGAHLHIVQMKPDSGSESKIAPVGAKKVNGDFSSLLLHTVDIYYFHLGYSPRHVLLRADKGAAVRHPSPCVLIKASTCEEWVQKMRF